jgi:hypothetical protein
VAELGRIFKYPILSDFTMVPKEDGTWRVPTPPENSLLEDLGYKAL